VSLMRKQGRGRMTGILAAGSGRVKSIGLEKLNKTRAKPQFPYGHKDEVQVDIKGVGAFWVSSDRIVPLAATRTRSQNAESESDDHEDDSDLSSWSQEEKENKNDDLSQSHR
jgi:hypothetical protein